MFPYVAELYVVAAVVVVVIAQDLMILQSLEKLADSFLIEPVEAVRTRESFSDKIIKILK